MAAFAGAGLRKVQVAGDEIGALPLAGAEKLLESARRFARPEGRLKFTAVTSDEMPPNFCC